MTRARWECALSGGVPMGLEPLMRGSAGTSGPGFHIPPLRGWIHDSLLLCCSNGARTAIASDNYGK